MKKVIDSIKSMKFLEKLFIVLIFISLLTKTAFHFKATLDLFAFSGFLAIIYFPLGFYFLGRSPSSNSYILSILLGTIYATCMAAFTLGLFGDKDYNIVYYIEMPILLIVLLIFSVKANGSSNLYNVTQVLRAAFLLIINIIVLIQANL